MHAYGHKQKKKTTKRKKKKIKKKKKKIKKREKKDSQPANKTDHLYQTWHKRVVQLQQGE